MRKKARARDGLGEPVDMTRHFKKRVFDEWRLKNGETVRVSTDRDAGFDLVHVRRWEGGAGALYPTEKGIAVAVSDLSRLLKALKKVRAHAREIGLLPKAKPQA